MRQQGEAIQRVIYTQTSLEGKETHWENVTEEGIRDDPTEELNLGHYIRAMNKMARDRIIKQPERHVPWLTHLDAVEKGEEEATGFLVQTLAEIASANINILRWDSGELHCRHFKYDTKRGSGEELVIKESQGG